MSQPCAIKNCKRASRTLCHCCNQNLCRDHFNEHDDLLNSKLVPLADEVNTLNDRISAINLDDMMDECRQELDQWRRNCYKTIDDLYQQKCRELQEYVSTKIDSQQQSVTALRTRVAELIDKQETTKKDIADVTSTIHNLAQSIESIEQNIAQVDTTSLKLDDTMIRIGEVKTQSCVLLKLSTPSHTIGRSGAAWNAVAANDQFLLLHMNSKLCLVDDTYSIVKCANWEYGLILGMCWSSSVNCFIVLTKQKIFLFNENTAAINEIHNIQNGNWHACGCSDHSLYLSQSDSNSSVFQFSLPSTHLARRLVTNQNENREQIDSITCNRGTILLALNNISIKAKTIQLRSDNTFNILWSFQLDVTYNSNRTRCCSLSQNQWLVTDWYTSRIFHLTQNGLLKATCTYSSRTYDIILFHSNILTILTDGRIDFHRI
ncbi:unnamed protein product [Adineta ricciae]|uniref:B box-type domain-containing protein n=1 Tax=Adineta ricciae TaxID=249248 RepID=A0A813SD30_ADIRI|nr:unnamed protein product [Adineta ricciae]CAF1382980.1 unnamed protein product [Adineta ricciae]